MKYLKPTMLVFLCQIIALVIVVFVQIFVPDMFTSMPMKVIMGIMLGVFVIITIISFFDVKISLKKIGFWALHAGLIIFLFGSFLYAITGSYDVVTVSKSSSYSSLTSSEGNKISLDFSFRFTDFKMEVYDPVYDVYRVDSNNNSKQIMSDIEIVSNKCDFGKYGIVVVDTKTEIVLDRSGKYTIVAKRRANSPKHYEGTIKYTRNGITKDLTIEVNKTVRMGKYKVFLMSYNSSMGGQITLLFKNDYGEAISVIGIWLTILGVFHMCMFEDVVNQALNKRALAKRPVSNNKKAKGGRA